MTALRLSGIRKSFAGRQVLDDISLALSGGTVTLLLGANGAGKTTLLRIAAGLSRADRGEMTCDGAPWKPLEARCGYAGHALMLYGALTVRENISLFLGLRGGGDVQAALERWELVEHTNREVRLLSKGLQYRASLCRAFLGEPRVAILDEPSSSLDDRSFAILERRLAERKDAVVLVATHDIHRFGPLAERVVVLHDGALRADSDDVKFGATVKERVGTVISAYREWNR
jgi:heme exporter protein A